MRDPTGRTPADYAIEHAEYLATAAEVLLDAVNALAAAQEAADEGDEDPDRLRHAREDADECMRTVRNGIHEFRKRAHRAKLQANLNVSRETPGQPQTAGALLGPTFAWGGGGDPATFGTATFKLGERELHLPLAEFAHGQALADFATATWLDGLNAGHRALAQLVIGAVEDYR